LNKLVKQYLYLGLLAGVIVGLDQLTKTVVRSNMELGEVWMPLEWLSPYVRIVHWYNTGVAFGMFQGYGFVFTILALIVVGIIIYIYPQVPTEDWSLRLAMGMQLGGAIGNLIDRLTVGHVTDWFSVGTFPVFNVADASISVGVGVLILGVWIQEREQRKQAANPADSPAPGGDGGGEPGALLLHGESEVE
jgi:signal peptidase II